MASQTPDREVQGGVERGRTSSREIGAGLFLIALAAVGLAGGWKLNFGQLSGIGPGLMPRVTALIVAAFGVLLIVQGLTTLGDKLEAWSVRGMFFVLGAVFVFAATIRTCGLLVAGPLVVGLSALADRDTRAVEVITFSLMLTALCGIMFKDVLNLPIPFDPLGIVPGPVAALYVAFKAWIASSFGFLLKLFR